MGKSDVYGILSSLSKMKWNIALKGIVSGLAVGFLQESEASAAQQKEATEKGESMIVFDLDGTLFQTHKTCTVVLKELCGKYRPELGPGETEHR